MQELIPAHLIIGQDGLIQAHAEQLLQKALCPHAKTISNQGECFCTTCRKIKQRQHQHILWLNPEQDYKTDDLSIIFEKAHFALDPGQRFYFVLEKSETLNTASANRLLKILEEPPTGYHFILLTTNEQALLTTIRSRCTQTYVGGNDKEKLHPFLNFFCTSIASRDPLEFEQSLRQYHFSDTQSTQLAYELLNYFTQKMATQSQDPSKISTIKDYHRIIIFLQKALQRPPQSGSSELFWKNIYLNFPFKI